MKMQKAEMEFVTFDAQDVIATSGGMKTYNFLYSSVFIDEEALTYPMQETLEFSNLGFTETWTTYANSQIFASDGSTTGGYLCVLEVPGVNVEFGYNQINPGKDENYVGIDVKDWDLYDILSWLSGANNGPKLIQ